MHFSPKCHIRWLLNVTWYNMSGGSVIESIEATFNFDEAEHQESFPTTPICFGHVLFGYLGGQIV